MNDQLLIQLENVTLRVRQRFLLTGTSWRVKQGQHWAVLGPNGAGKTSLVCALTGDVPVVRGRLSFFQLANRRIRVARVSFEQHQRLIAREDQRDASRDFSGRFSLGVTVNGILLEKAAETGRRSSIVSRVAGELQIQHLLERPIRVLSSGEMRKVQIARMLIEAPDVFILDEPFDGLDPASRRSLMRIVDLLMDASRAVILVSHRYSEISPRISHVLALKDGAVAFQGRREDVLTPERLDGLYPASQPASFCLPSTKSTGAPDETALQVLVAMKNVSVRYAGVSVLEAVNWTMKSGENWIVMGPNGCGKTSLLNLICGDNPQAYANEIYLFGRRRGSGESLWEIKEKIGMISSELQIRYRKALTGLEVVISGFFDSVGLYRNASEQQIEKARQWMQVLGIAGRADYIFSQLSYGEQRMVLLARCMVKMPPLLILDEPYQGLDRANRLRLMNAVNSIGRCATTSIIYVTHLPDEIPACMTHMLEFKRSAGEKYKIRQARWRPPR